MEFGLDKCAGKANLIEENCTDNIVFDDLTAIHYEKKIELKNRITAIYILETSVVWQAFLISIQNRLSFTLFEIYIKIIMIKLVFHIFRIMI